jgi:hypothetical protein
MNHACVYNLLETVRQTLPVQGSKSTMDLILSITGNLQCLGLIKSRHPELYQGSIRWYGYTSFSLQGPSEDYLQFIHDTARPR